MTDDVHDLLNEDEVHGSVNELIEAVKSFDTLDAVVIIWADKEGTVVARMYGTPTNLSGMLARAQHKVMHEEEID